MTKLKQLKQKDAPIKKPKRKLIALKVCVYFEISVTCSVFIVLTDKFPFATHIVILDCDLCKIQFFRELSMPKIPKVDMKAHINSVGESIKQFHMPTPQEVKENFVNSGFHKQFSQPLAVRTRVEEVDIQHQREMMTKRKTPSELSQMNHPLDIPFPKIKLPSTKTVENDDADQDQADKSRLYNTLPRSWRQQNIVTSSRAMDNQEEAAKRQELVKTKSPAQLAEFNTIADFPLPTRVKQILSPSERKIQSQKQRKLSVSSSRWKFGSLFGSGGDLKRAQSDTNIKVKHFNTYF